MPLDEAVHFRAQRDRAHQRGIYRVHQRVFVGRSAFVFLIQIRFQRSNIDLLGHDGFVVRAIRIQIRHEKMQRVLIANEPAVLAIAPAPLGIRHIVQPPKQSLMKIQN